MKTVKNGGYIDGLKEAKRLVSEGRVQLKSARNIYFGSIDAEFLGAYCLSDEKQENSVEKKGIAIEKITRGLEIYRGLLIYENINHFKRIKTAMEHTLKEFEENIPTVVQERCYNALFISPE